MTESTSNRNAIDMEFLKKIIGEDAEFQKELFQIFLENSEFNIKKMQNALLNNDNNAWYMAAHALKGASASIGAFDLAKIFEKCQKSADIDDQVKNGLIEEVQKEFKNVEDFIKKDSK